ncbi:MAG TPA: DUF3857 domain-containing protein, partial [Bryobacteraceae bacterium]|nr:DUF3857 domain-containing protein [Bryobacteraceae bacterium]
MKSAYLLLALSLPLAAGKDLPSWIQEAAHRPMPSYSSKVTQEVLFSEERLAVAPDGKRSMTERQAIRILQTSKHSLFAARTYNTKTGRIRDFRAWMLPTSGSVVEYDKKRIVDVALDQQGSYDEARAKVIECDPNSSPGTIFAYEVTEDEDTIFTTYHYAFQDADPTAVSRFVLTLPAAWEENGILFNHAPVAPQTSGNTYTWELRDLPWIEAQDYGPGMHDLAPRLGVTYFPASTPNHALTPLKDWTSVSSWFARFADPAAALTPPVSSKTSELTRAAANDMDRIRALAKFVQQTNYVSVQMNIEHGGGYTPRPATDVLQKNYGDCKDKATLLRALLKGAGIDSYAVSLYSGDRDYVKREWASPMQFNHAIIAIKLPAGVESLAAVESAKLGRLLIFDPTDPYTPVGDL